MTTVELGTNRFVDCRALLGYGGTDLVAVATDPLSVSLHIPEAATETGDPIAVEGGVLVQGQGLTIAGDERSFAIYAGDVLVAVALRRDSTTVHLKLDLRPLGLHIYDDVEGLHVGTNVFARNEIQNAAVAIALA